ncbi:hypothetical protein AU156_gp023 [Edwardsiella phage PEi20]|uniref:Uncharacterized protein n=2 Tax=Kanagawavirus pei20 TaxID=2844109 RepID=A0A0B6VRD0_9CAUD|nr:hypothetical protein AU156_gp023 [Edwardsiella phage PEi20]BAQ22673.1 conserved hypothetical protein [Edwardsiella phage PEi20]BAQ22974.1 conserved hypothetical protein [Edwardsiella phage PEi26]
MFKFIKNMFASKPLPEKMVFVEEEKEYVYMGDGMIEEVVKPKETEYQRQMRLIQEARKVSNDNKKKQDPFGLNIARTSQRTPARSVSSQRSTTSNTNTYVDDTPAYVAAAVYSSPSYSSSDSYSSCDSSSSFSGSCD